MQFSRRHHLDRHNLIQNCVKFLACTTCEKAISEPQDIKEHFFVDTSTGIYTCGKCGKQFAVFMKLVKHIARHHRNNGTYHCCQCQRVHAEERPFECNVCKKCFALSASLKSHTRENNCGVCMLQFLRHQHLAIHNLLHTGLNFLVCSRCHKGIPESQELMEYFFIDTTSGKYACSKCNQQFTVFKKLTEHISRYH